MNLPSSREIELETLLRQRDTQVVELSVRVFRIASTNRSQPLKCPKQDEISHLRQYLSTQPGPSITDSISLPPTLVSYLLPHLTGAIKAPGASSTTSGTGSSTVTAALVQRTKLLQEENDELYELLKSGETGKLKEEVRGLRKVVDRLERALKGGVLSRPRCVPFADPICLESHQVITSLS